MFLVPLFVTILPPQQENTGGGKNTKREFHIGLTLLTKRHITFRVITIQNAP